MIRRQPAVRVSSITSILSRRTPLAAATAAAVLALSACGGSPTEATATASASGVSVADSFPTGLSVGVPTELGSSTASSSSFDGERSVSGWRRTVDFSRAAWTAAARGDTRTLGRLASALVPVGNAHAATAMEPGIKADAVMVERLATGDTGVVLGGVLDPNKLFGSGGNNATCYGPTLVYSAHDDGPDAVPAQLPSGDLGLWRPTEAATTQPCIAAQLNAKVSGVKGRVRQGLLLMAVMRKTATALPAAGASVDIRSSLETVLAGVPSFSGVTVDAATIGLDAGGALYTYRLVISAGSGVNAVSGEVVMKHTPGASSTEYSGVMQVAGFQLSNDVAFGCSDELDGTTGRYKVARVSTLKYTRDGRDVGFGSREAQYCGHASAADATYPTDFAAQVAAKTSDGQLDPAVKLGSGFPAVRGGAKGWRGSFNRFAGAYDRVTVDGDFLFAWQAGVGDGHSRAMAAHSRFNTVTEIRSLDGYFAFAGDVATTDGTLLGMVCNWAGPGNNHTPVAKFQSQSATLAAAATEFTLGASLIAYAPTKSCSASGTMSFDVDANGTLSAGEGASTSAALDAPSGSNTVQQEIDARGFVKPSLF
jgi:hypothetical protein